MSDKEKQDQEAKDLAPAKKATPVALISIVDYCDSMALTDRDKYAFCKILAQEEPRSSEEWQLLISKIA